jgi:hypothetical protein
MIVLPHTQLTKYKISAEVDLLLVFLLESLCLGQSHYVLLLVEMLHLELSAELQDLLCFALSLWDFSHMVVEGFVQTLEVLFFLSLSHEKERRQLGIVILEGFSLLW